MKKAIRLLTIFFFFFSSCTVDEYEKYSVDKYLDKAQQEDILRKITRYAAKRPKYANDSTRFESKFDNYYQEEVKKYRFELYYIDPQEGYHYFMISRPAPSLKEKRTNIAGRFKLGQPNGFDFYEEIFRMYKMEEAERREKGLFLFKLMLEKADLTPYWGVNHPEEYIEFPDPHNYFDVSERRWKKRNAEEIELGD